MSESRFTSSDYGLQVVEAHQRVAKSNLFIVDFDQFDWPSIVARTQLDYFQRMLLHIIEKRKIETFFFCKENAMQDDEQFWEDSVSRGLTNMLRWIFVKATKLEFSVACYVSVGNRVLVLTSGSLMVEHFTDVDDSVAVLCSMLKTRIDNYLFLNCGVRLSKCIIKCLRLNVNHPKDYRDTDTLMTLPLQYRHLLKRHSQKSDLRTIHAIVSTHLMGIDVPLELDGKLYRLEQYGKTRKLNIWLHHSGGRLHPNECKRNFVFINDILGNFNNVLEISDPMEICDEWTSERCKHCDRFFYRHTAFVIHQKLSCGEELSVDTIYSDYAEVFEQCLPIIRNHNFSCYGVTKVKRYNIAELKIKK